MERCLRLAAIGLLAMAAAEPVLESVRIGEDQP